MFDWQERPFISETCSEILNTLDDMICNMSVVLVKMILLNSNSNIISGNGDIISEMCCFVLSTNQDRRSAEHKDKKMSAVSEIGRHKSGDFQL